MLTTVELAGAKQCFATGGFMYCTWVARKTANGPMAMFPNNGGYLKFPIKWKHEKEKAPPNLEALKSIVDIIHQKNEKTPSLQA